MVRLLLVLAVIVIAIALLPTALRVLATYVLPPLAVLLASVVALLDRDALVSLLMIAGVVSAYIIMVSARKERAREAEQFQREERDRQRKAAANAEVNYPAASGGALGSFKALCDSFDCAAALPDRRT